VHAYFSSNGRENSVQYWLILGDSVRLLYRLSLSFCLSRPICNPSPLYWNTPIQVRQYITTIRDWKSPHYQAPPPSPCRSRPAAAWSVRYLGEGRGGEGWGGSERLDQISLCIHEMNLLIVIPTDGDGSSTTVNWSRSLLASGQRALMFR